MKANLKTRFVTLFIITSFFASPVLAVERMESDSYKLKWPNLNMTSGSKSSDNYNILDTIGQTAPGEYASSGFYVKAGFPYIKTIIPFGFTISDISIDFNELIPTSFKTRSNTLTVSYGGSGGYQVTASEASPLKLIGTATAIPDTTCDTSCDETVADTWTNTSKYGFGYNLTGDDIPLEFIDPPNTPYKQFADESSLESPQIVMSSNNVGTNRVATVTYQLNVSPSQASGNYATSIMFLATSTY